MRSSLSVYSLLNRVMAEIAVRSGKCHALDLFAPLHVGAWKCWSCVETQGGGFAQTGSAEETGLCASDNTAAFDGVRPAVGENTSRSASNRSRLQTPLVITGFIYRAEQSADDDDNRCIGSYSATEGSKDGIDVVPVGKFPRPVSPRLDES